MKIDNEFTVGAGVDRTWDVLTDLEGVAPCMPGAELTGVEGDVYKGRVKVKVGPVISQYAGTAQFVEKDAAVRHAVISAKGKDARGAGTASALIDAQLRADGNGGTVVTVSTDLNVTGKIAQFGSGMIKEVSTKLLGQFVANLEERLALPAATEPASAATEPTSSEPAATEPAATSTPTAAQQTAPVEQGTAPPATAKPATAPLDLMGVAGGSLYKRLIPLAAGLVLLVALAVYFVVR